MEYEIIGGDMQMVQIELDLAETIVAEAGDMTYMVENEFISVRL